MELTNEFHVGVPVAHAWSVLTDVERIAPCLPGAQLTEVQGDEYRGTVKVKVGPITAQYKGTATFVERDEAGGRAVLQAKGRDTRGQGNAEAKVTATLVADGEGTRVTVTTDLAITGKVAQFGRGVLAEVSTKLLGQFVDCLESDVLAAIDDGAPTAVGEAVAEGATASSGPPLAAIVEDAAPAPVAATAIPVQGAIEAPATTAPIAAPAAAPATPAGPAPKAAAPATPAGPAAGSSVNGAKAPTGQVRRIDSRPAEPVDLLDAAGGSVAKRLAPVAAAVVVVGLVVVIRRRRGSRRR